jgi:hypothetical protein
MITVYHLARGCESIGTFDNPSDRDDVLLAMLKIEVAVHIAAGRSAESGDNEYRYAVDVSGHRAEMYHMDVDEDGVTDDLGWVQDAEWVDDDAEGIWYTNLRTWDQCLWWHEMPTAIKGEVRTSRL